MANDKEQIRHLLALIDDPSERVRGSVRQALLAFGDGLADALDEGGATKEQSRLVSELVGDDSESDQLFEVGQLVRHRRYGYRGVVVAVDTVCRASEGWYQGNQTQPDRDQPWYHVLADGSDQVFYPAQTSLLADESSDEVENPYVKHFFSEFLDGTYVRNDRPFPAAQ
ncbi:TPA: heat shock protein HspQ [Candidatus Latescibacteria bacterium]|nr:heat shock protein HspQ [Candidatus Latescibacterota bacterium]